MATNRSNPVRSASLDGAPAPASPQPTLDARSLGAAVSEVCARDEDLAGIVARHGPPPLWARPAGFGTLVAIILEQQVSLRSAASALERLRTAAGAIEPAALTALGENGVRAAGQTRQKARYVVALADAAVDGRFAPEALAAAPDEDVRTALTSLLGIGRWSADIYLLMALGRPDVWPEGDLALAAALARAKRLDALPDRATQRRLADAWRPWRAVGARILWHAYLAGERPRSGRRTRVG